MLHLSINISVSSDVLNAPVSQRRLKKNPGNINLFYYSTRFHLLLNFFNISITSTCIFYKTKQLLFLLITKTSYF